MENGVWKLPGETEDLIMLVISTLKLVPFAILHTHKKVLNEALSQVAY